MFIPIMHGVSSFLLGNYFRYSSDKNQNYTPHSSLSHTHTRINS